MKMKLSSWKENGTTTAKVQVIPLISKVPISRKRTIDGPDTVHEYPVVFFAGRSPTVTARFHLDLWETLG